MSKKPKPLKTLEARIGELEDELKQRDTRIRELRNDLNKAEALISEEREHVEDADALIDSWIEAFEMVQNEDGKWTYAEWVDDCVAMNKRYKELVKKWNRNVTAFNNTIAPRNVGRPLGASEAQVQQVRKLHKVGKSLRAIQEETNLGFQTVRTIIDQRNGRDRTTVRHLQRIDPGRFKEEPWRERTRTALPKRITETLERGRELVKAAKGLKQAATATRHVEQDRPRYKPFPAVEEWRSGLSNYQRRSLNNPVIVWRKWTAATRVQKPKPRTANVSASEHGRAQAMIVQLQARVAELEEELATARERIAELEAPG